MMSSSPVSKNELVKLYRQAVAAGISLEKVQHKVEKLSQRDEVTQAVEKQDHQQKVKKINNQLPRIVKLGAALVPVFFISIGLFLVGNAVLPILGYYIWEMPKLQAKMLTAPIPPEQVLDANPIIITEQIAGVRDEFGEVGNDPVIIDNALDYTNLSNWFADVQVPELQGASNGLAELVGVSSMPGVTDETYTIDIPKLKITNAQVTVGGTNLNKSLIHYAGTAMPGDAGSPVIFGHSVLRQFYNPSEKNPRRYTSIFSTIMTLKKGDEIYVTRNNVKYTYRVEEKTEVKPQDVHILAQQYDSRRLKLVTCTPEGTYLRRGVITAVLVDT